MKKILALIITFVFTFQLNGLGVGIAYAAELGMIGVNNSQVERTINEGTCNSIAFDKTIVKVGEKLKLIVDLNLATTDISSVQVSYKIGNILQYSELSYDAVSNKYVIEWNITQELEFKNIEVNNIIITDKNYNTQYINTYQFGTIKASVANSNGVVDNEMPVFNSITLSKNIVKVGENLIFSVDANDAISGIDSIYVYYNCGSMSYVNKALYDTNTNKYIFQILISEDMVYKHISVGSLKIEDKAGNVKWLAPYEFSCGMTYIADKYGAIDNEAPVLNKIEINSNTLKVGDKLRYTIDSSDSLSGIDYIELSYYIGNLYYPMVRFNYDEQTKKYYYEIQITSNMTYQNIKATNLRILDKAGNEKTLSTNDLIMINASVTDENGLVDDQCPSFNGISFSSTNPKVGETLSIYIDTNDSLSGIGSINLSSNITTGYNPLFLSFNYDTIKNKYKADVTITDDMKYGKLKFSWLNISDMAGNTLNVSDMELKDYSIFIADSNGNIDSEKPQVISTTISNNKPKIGDVVNISIDARDNLSGIKEIGLTYDMLNRVEQVNLSYNSTTNKYEGQINITSELEYCKLTARALWVYDKAGNETTLYSDELASMAISVYGANGKLDLNAPVLSDVAVNKTLLKVGEKLKISIAASDDASGIKEINISYEVKGRYNSDKMIYNPQTDKYEKEIEITNDMLYSRIAINGLYAVDNTNKYSYKDYYEVNSISILITDSNGGIDNVAPVLNSWEMIKDNINKIKINVADDKAGVSMVDVSFINKRVGNYSKVTVPALYDEGSGAFYVELLGGYFFNNSKYEVDTISIQDYAGNIKIIRAGEKDFSNLDFVVGNYVENPIVNISNNKVFYGDNEVVGKTSLPNTKLLITIYDVRGGKEVLKPITSDSNGNFVVKFNVLDMFYARLLIDAIDSTSNAVLNSQQVIIHHDVDFDDNKVVNIKDMAEMALNYNKTTVDDKQLNPLWKYDTNYDGIIDLYDLTYLNGLVD